MIVQNDRRRMAVGRWSEAVGRERGNFAKMKIFLPLVVWIVLLFRTASSQYSASRKNVGIFGLKHEVFFLNLEDGYFGCQVNESTDYLQLYELSKLCDGTSDCYMGSDELRNKLKCTNDCDKDGTACSNGVCLEGQCHCNDGFGGCNCQVPDENECKYRPCDVFAHCTNTLGSFTCTCFPGYRGDGFHCEDIDECQDPSIAARCVENAECCNLPAHFVCKCKSGFEGDGEEHCADINECLDPQACGVNAECVNYPGNYTCLCKEGFVGDPYNGCGDVDECAQPGVCGPGAICTNLEGGYRCDCPAGFDGDARSAQGCADFDECTRSPCGRNALCRNEIGAFRCECPEGFHGDPMTDCEAACTATDECNQDEICLKGQCLNPCHEENACGMNAECLMTGHLKQCSCPAGFTGDSALECVRIPILCASNADCIEGTACQESMCLPRCGTDQDCALNEKCIGSKCMLTCRLDNDCFLGHICLNGRCIYGCHSDDDCSASETCRNNRCIDPCRENPCGPNAACSVVNHRASCSCMSGMVPNPTAKVACVRAPALQCTENRDCAEGTSCIENLCRPVCANDQGCLNNERCDRGTCKPICRRDDDCRTGEVCQGQTCMIGCRSDTGCPAHLACVHQQCTDPCLEPTACGTNAECSVVNHRKQCACPPPLLGDPLTGCRAEQRSCQARTDCPKGQACYGNTCMPTCRNDQNCLADERCIRGTCRTVCNSDASCSNGLICENRICQAGCRTDNNCPNNQACINKQCTDPCTVLGQCGVCSECSVVNHGVQCSCPNGYLGNPLVSCSPPPQKCNSYCYCDEDGVFCADKCRQAKDCACGQTCQRGRCRTKCNPGACPPGQLCQNGACMAGCRSNADCPGERSCVNRKCTDPCAGGTACGKNAICQVADHQALCLCPDGFQGDPRQGCIQYECQTNDNCDLDKKCIAGKCTNPCLEDDACGLNAQCRVVNRQAQCSCTPGFFGNARQGCQPLQKNSCSQNPCGENTVCREDANGYECSCQVGCMGDPRRGCLCGGKQTNKCENYPCGKNAVCRITAHDQPECYCPPLYSGGDPYSECTNERTVTDCRTTGCIEGECVRDGTKFICRNDESCANDMQCPNEKACIGGKCSDPCSLRGACGDNALCQTVLHRPRCSCPSCYVGRPNVECKPDPKCQEASTPKPSDPKIVSIVCETEQDCDESLRCDSNGQCSDPCTIPTTFVCEPNKKCVSRRHRPVCVCKHGFIVNEYGELICAPEKRECHGDDGCASNMACIDGKCLNPCMPTATRDPACPEDKACLVMDHKPACICMKDCSPSLSICLRDSGCPADLACRNYQCVNPCETTLCADDTPCFVEDHKPICKFCPPGFVKDAHQGCLKEIGCRHNNECPPERSCVNGVCIDLCRSGNPCEAGQECEVQNHEPVCIKLCECQKTSDCPSGRLCDGCNCIQQDGPQRTGCEHCPPGIPCDPITGACVKVQCTSNDECPLMEACVGNVCRRPCDVQNPCAPNAVCINRNHGSDCSCIEGFHGNGFVGCQRVTTPGSVCQYNEDCPPDKLCDRLNRICINPCQEDSCGDNAECLPKNHGIECRCRDGFSGNAYIECNRVHGCRSDSECNSYEACVNGQCASPCQCGAYALCDVRNHKPQCKCPPGYKGDARLGCSPPSNPCDPNPCGLNAMCEVDAGSAVCYCPKGLTGNPFKNCIPEGDECTPNPCGPNSGCRKINGNAACFCLPEFEGHPPEVPCKLPQNPCDPSPCGPNTQCTILNNGFAKCTCLSGYIESPNTIRGCIEPRNPCEPNPCGLGAICDSSYNPVCYCPEGLIGNPFRSCVEPIVTPELCKPGPCGGNADCYIAEGREQCYCSPGYIGDPYVGCTEQPRSVCEPNPCGPGAECLILTDGSPACRCPAGVSGDPTSAEGCRGLECTENHECAADKACIGFQCVDPCPGACGTGAYCKVEKHHPVCFCAAGLTGNPAIRCYTEEERIPDQCSPNPCGLNTQCTIRNRKPVCKCLPNFKGDPRKGCTAECILNSDCPSDKACTNRRCVPPCSGQTCGVNAECHAEHHTPMCKCPNGFTGNAFVYCVPILEDRNMTKCDSTPCGPHGVCSVYNNDFVICDPCSAPDAVYNPRCRPQCVINADCPFNLACIQGKCQDPCPGSCGHDALCSVELHSPLCTCPRGLYGDPYVRCVPQSTPMETCDTIRCGANTECKRMGGVLACVCRKNYFGDPLVGCRPECVLNTDCPVNKACVNNRCQDPCDGVCGVNALCKVVNHHPRCYCPPTHTGDGLIACTEKTYLPPPDATPCDPNPCGANSKCLPTPDNYAVCSCLPGFRGIPPACQAECMINAECPQNKACVNLKCIDPCPGTCGAGARCEVLNHNPICSCPQNYKGDPLTFCEARENDPPPEPPRNPCDPSPCGVNSICQVKRNRPVCSCQPNFIGSPPYCRPECVLSSECPQDKACINEKCRNPCENACGRNAECHVVAHSAFCNCLKGFAGDAFIECSRIPETPPQDPCNGNPCAENALCTTVNNAVKCTCIAPYLGDPYNTGCRPECVLNSDCPSHLGCVNQHCRDPCPGICGPNAECIVANHVAVCECNRGFIGDPFKGCRRDVPPPIDPKDPCEQCPRNSVCRIIQGRPTCSCPEGYRGAPPACRPECSNNEECRHDQSCINLKCKDPCPGLCGINAQCQVINHKPFCSCLPEYYGDPFQQCMQRPKDPIKPCDPSPCGPHSECRELNDRAVCSCVPGMLGAPPNCRPECETHQDCPSSRACFARKCKDPCIGTCGFNAFCVTRDHRPECYCMEGHEGDPYNGCNPTKYEVTTERAEPCNPSPCGPNAECKERNGAGSCSCMPDYFGDPYTGCRPECVQNSDCDKFRACVNNKCKDPCPGVCGLNAECRVQNHNPICTCIEGYVGDPNRRCEIQPTTSRPEDVCYPSTCGPHSHCRAINGHAVCSCKSGYIGTPPSCRPECVVSSECSQDRACENQKCIDPCPGPCGPDARCQVVNHNAICSCPPGFTGNPFELCSKYERDDNVPVPPSQPCSPSPCGPNSECRVVGTQAACTCQPNYVGRPPNCRPECTNDAECASNLACQRERCVDPCPGACGANAVCQAINHKAICTCQEGYEGNPSVRCALASTTTERLTPCVPSPCGPNAVCRERNNAGSCECKPGYEGTPYDVFSGCRRECEVNSDCAQELACVSYKCVDPCPGVCGVQAYCKTDRHIPKCVCPDGMIGDPFIQCEEGRTEPPPPAPPVCDKDTCGPNSICRIQNGVAVCKCQPEMTGSPPNCRPQCVVSADCDAQKACVNYKCIDPCPGSCGKNAKCQVINHNPICSCSPDFTGDPFSRCYKDIITTTVAPRTPCSPSPCGPNAECKVVGNREACSCLPDYIGSPPDCRPECILSADCVQNQACIRQKCIDPCPGLCGPNARCTVVNHIPSCSCEERHTGDPFTYCHLIQATPPPPAPKDPCYSSPCGTNARCRPVDGGAVCECLENYYGNPYTACRPECVINSDCSRNTACIQNRCKDPCPGVCAISAECSVINHTPVCTCPEGKTGNGFEGCHENRAPPPPSDPCYPSPCGLNTVCRNSNGNAVCECLPDFKGTPFGRGCYPECTINSDCPRDKTCVNKKCVDPCPGVCGYRAICNAINNSPVCSCPSNMIGDPFVECKEAPPKDPCNPSPCRTNGICRDIGGRAECVYPECVINSDCSYNRACFNQKCRDPCVGACGVNAICNVVNNVPICSCPENHMGSPFVQCVRQRDPLPEPECTSDDQCTNNKACINQRCINPCTNNNGLCNHNAECYVQFHRAICTCRAGYTGNAQVACYEIGCRADSDCPATEACVNKDCVDPCRYTQCGRNAACRADYNHNARCHCLDGYRGNPLTSCSRPECTRDDECPYHLSCQNEQCKDPCNCAPGAQCRVDNHRASCRCPPGYTGDATFACEKPPIRDPEQCKMDAECPSKMACFSGVCKNPCYETKPCADHAVCTVHDTLPLRTMFCVCDEGYVGNAEKQCLPASKEEPGCSSDVECAATETCRNRACVNPCTEFNPCHRTAECLAQSHKAICSCPVGTVGDPFRNCYRQPVIQAECTTDSDCASNRACVNQKCQNPCAEGNPCAGNAECFTQNHRPLCTCPRGWGGDPKVQCYKPECQHDSDCPYDKACYNEKCLNPCTYGSPQCGQGAECLPQGHRANCVCPPGTQGNPLISCVTGLCQYNEDCADHEACDRLNRVCRPVCDDQSCAAQATCFGRNHQATCECAPGARGNPYVQCDHEPEPECRVDGDCRSQQACINNRCDNPCTHINPCSQQQTCTVVDTLPLRTMICACPSDMLVDVNGQCKPIVVEGCRTDSDCPDTDRCVRGQCMLACRADPCGVNAQCVSESHRARCSCAPGYIGNPHIECNQEARVPRIKDCTVDNECPIDQSCQNEYCENPCQLAACGRGAICFVQMHEAVCNCPSNHTKDRNGNCIPYSANLPKCQSNSACSPRETCINGYCTSPCSCGKNADCFVKDHYPICTCKPGFTGDAQFGCRKLGCESDSECSNDKRCYNGECLNPCALENPCALNAECFGDNHRAECRCQPGLEGNPFIQCRRVECHFDAECPDNNACVREQCINPCSEMNPCAQNAICFTRNHAAYCKCPDHLPDGNPFSFCEYRKQPDCLVDVDCPSRMACIENKCVNPCDALLPCARSAKCTVLDSVPVRTMVCECPELHVPDVNGECKRIVLPQPECTRDSECSDKEACINRQCRNPCNCGEHTTCTVKNHRAICSCENGYEGDPRVACKTIGCRVDSECEASKACINGNCVNPCLNDNPCGVNAECYAISNRAECRCLSGYRGNPLVQCSVVECRSNNDCPNDKQCRNSKCVNPCVYDSSCSPRAECKAHNHLAVCKCPPGLVGNPYVDCRPEIIPECEQDVDCPSYFACIENKCVEPCGALEPCSLPARCEAIPSLPVRTMICVCPDGYVSSGSGTCKLIVKEGCISDSDCSSDTACINSICANPCSSSCGPNAECRIKDHKPVCSCRQGFDGNPEIECIKTECRTDDDCSPQHSCINRQCVPVCTLGSCGRQAECYAQNHRAICECLPGYEGDPRVTCKLLGCRADSDCPLDKACINSNCENPCESKVICAQNEHCQVYQHQPECACPPPFEPDPIRGCVLQEERCRTDGECPSQTACIQGECVNPCNVTSPCGVNSMCKVLDTLPVRTMICECLLGYQGNAAIQCDKMALCQIDRGFVRNANGECVCPPGYGLTIYDDCQLCRAEDGFKVDQYGRCICATERGMIVDERGRCICPIEHGYRLTEHGECLRTAIPECTHDDDCLNSKYCNEPTKTCEDPCQNKICGNNAFCNVTYHQAVCQCLAGYTGNPDEQCTPHHGTDFPQPDMQVTCQADGVQVVIRLIESHFNGVLYVKGHSKDEECRRVVNLAGDESQLTQLFKVHFGSCGLIHVNGIASFVLVIQKHPKLVTYKAQAYHIKCVYQTGEQNVTLGFNVQMLTTAGTIANTGPPPTCSMRIVAYNGEEINSAEIGDNLRLQVEVQPATIYGGFARSCVAKTMEDSVENEYVVTDENGCATEPSIFGDWEYNPDTNSLLASFNAFKFPSSDNIRFQCNIRVCFGRCQPVNCRGANAFGKRRRRAITDMHEIEVMLNRTRRATSTALAPDDTLGIEGTLREEITIQSNAILTLERREERSYDSDNITPAAQRVEDICVSMIGLIIALVITALLALVAVAVAVSCWLMAYRRRPTVTGPLPHPPEFPNPLFAHHEPSEPSHDYMT